MGTGNIKKFELKLGKTGLIIVIGGMTALLCLSFVLGVGVGKNIDTYPEKISSMPQQVLALFWRPAKVSSGQKVVESKDAQPDKSSMDLTFHNALTSPKTPSMPPAGKQAVVADQKVTPQTIPVPLPKNKKAVSSEEDVIGQKILDREKSLEENKSRNKEVSAVAPPVRALFFIQVASLKDKVKANQIHKTVAAMGYPSKVLKMDIKEKGIWYRVLATGFETKTQAQTAADRISKKVKVKCIVRTVGSNTDKNE
jgi:cell division septation protein DedD